MKKISILFLLLTSINFSQSLLQNPKVIKNVCPFECCQYGEWVVHETINVHPKEGDDSEIKFQLDVNDTIFAEYGNLHFVQIGKVVVFSEIYNFNVNDTLDVYNCAEGEFLVSHKDKEYYVDVFWSMYESDSQLKNEEKLGEMIQEPKSIWWVKIKSKQGIGWIKLVNLELYCFRIDKNISGLDGCS